MGITGAMFSQSILDLFGANMLRQLQTPFLLNTALIFAFLLPRGMASAEDSAPDAAASVPKAAPTTPAPKTPAAITTPTASVANPKAETQPQPREVPADIRDMTNFNYVLDMAQVHLRYGALERAEELLRKAQTNAKNDEEKSRVNASLGSLLEQKQDLKGAASAYEAAIGATQNEALRAQFSIVLAGVYTQQGESEKAEKIYRETYKGALGSKSMPENAWAKNVAWQGLMGVWQKQPAKLEQAVAEAEDTVAKDPKDKAALEHLGELYVAMKSPPAKTATVYEKLLELNPADLNAQSRLSNLYRESKQYEKAIAVQKMLLATDPKGLGQSAVYQVAQLLLESSKKDDAVAWMKEHANDSPSGTSSLEMFYEQAGMPAEAEDVLLTQAEQATGPQKSELLLRAADLARQRKEYKKAEERIRAVLKDAKDDKPILTRANTMLIRLFEEQGRIGELKL